MAASDILAPGVTNAITEFVNGFTGACGEAAAAILSAAQNAVAPSAQSISDLTNSLIAQGLAAPNGTTSSQALAGVLNGQGVSVSVLDNWRAALSNVTTRPVELLLQNAQALPEDRGVLGHFISVVGFSPSTNKFIVSDPNTPQAKQGQFVQYSIQQLTSANPVNAIVPNNPTGGGPSTPSGSSGSVPILSGLGNISSSALQTALTGAGDALGATFANTVEKALGVNSAKDLGLRAVLIVAAGFLFLAALFAIVFNAQRRAAQVVQSPTGQMALRAAGAA